MGIHIALIGMSHPHGIPYLETLQSLKDVESIYIWDEDYKVLGEIKSQRPHKIAGFYKDIAGILVAPHVQAGLIALPTNLIPPVAGEFLRLGKHVLVEKPGARQAAELAPMVKLAGDRGLLFSVSYPRRCNPVALAIKNKISMGSLGRIVSFEARLIASQVKFRNPDMWLFKKEMAGGGILSWLGCHLIDLLRFWLGDEVESVSCQSANLSGEPIDVENTICMTLRFSRGSIGTMRLGYHLPVSKAGYVGGSKDTYLCVEGTDGFVRWTPRGEQSEEYEFQSVQSPNRGNGLTREFIETEEKKGYCGYEGWAFVRQFVQAVDSGITAAVVNGQDALNTLKVIDAAYLASENGRTVILDH